MKGILCALSVFLLSSPAIFGQRITVTVPAGGESWAVGSTHAIHWTHTGTMIGTVKIVLVQGGEWESVIVESTANDNSYGWTIPDTVAPGTYAVRVKTTDNAVMDLSADFTIQAAAEPMRVTSPHAGDQVCLGQSYDIVWNPGGYASKSVRIDLDSLAAGQPDILIAGPITNSGRFSGWAPTGIAAGSYLIKIRTTLPGNEAISGEFRIAVCAVSFGEPSGSCLTITKPAAGDRLAIGRTNEICWTVPEWATELCGNEVRISAVRQENGEEMEIAGHRSSASGSNSYNWFSIPTVYEDRLGEYQIRLISNTGKEALSGVFTLAAPGDIPAASCDFAIDSATLSSGESLDHGISFVKGADLNLTLTVNVRWNRIPAFTRDPARGSHRLEIYSVLAKELVSAGNNPANFFEGSADNSGMIRINVPIVLAADKVPDMIRDRFIPLEVRLIPSPSSHDADRFNNMREFKLRILNAPERPPDIVVEIDRSSLRAIRQHGLSKDFDQLSFYARFRVKNLARTEVGGPAKPIANVPFRFRIRDASEDPTQGHRETWVMAEVRADRWTEAVIDHTGKNTIPWRGNSWGAKIFGVNVDPDNTLKEKNRDNNYAEIEFTASAE